MQWLTIKTDFKFYFEVNRQVFALCKVKHTISGNTSGDRRETFFLDMTRGYVDLVDRVRRSLRASGKHRRSFQLRVSVLRSPIYRKRDRHVMTDGSLSLNLFCRSQRSVRRRVSVIFLEHAHTHASISRCAILTIPYSDSFDRSSRRRDILVSRASNTNVQRWLKALSLDLSYLKKKNDK